MLREAAGIERIIIRTGRTDLRLGIDRLASLVQVEYGLDPLEEGTMFLFCGNKADRIKGLLYGDGGFLLLTKRLSKGAFLWPRSVSEARELSHSAFDDLMRGYEVTSSIRVYRKKGVEAADCSNKSVHVTENTGKQESEKNTAITADFAEKPGMTV